jgi:hypothetical protein
VHTLSPRSSRTRHRYHSSSRFQLLLKCYPPQALAMASTLPLILYSYGHMALLSPRIIHHSRSFPVTLIGSSIHAIFSWPITRSNPFPSDRPLASYPLLRPQFVSYAPILAALFYEPAHRPTSDGVYDAIPPCGSSSRTPKVRTYMVPITLLRLTTPSLAFPLTKIPFHGSMPRRGMPPCWTQVPLPNTRLH